MKLSESDYRLIKSACEYQVEDIIGIKNYIETEVYQQLSIKSLTEGANECMAYDGYFTYKSKSLQREYEFYACLLVNEGKPDEIVVDEIGYKQVV